MDPQSRPRLFRFGPFELDAREGELRKHGIHLNLQEQPLKILVALLERPGQIVTREDLVRAVWSDGVFVDFERGLNAAVNRLRQTLSDSAESPRYVETVARRGYRWIAPLDGARPEQVVSTSTSVRQRPRRWPAPAFLLALSGLIMWWIMSRPKPESSARWARITADAGLTTDPAISSDGKLLAYSSDRAGGGGLDIWVQQLTEGGRAMQITGGPADEREPSFSPDGSKIVYRSEQDGGGVYIVSALGGEPTLLAQGGRDPRFSPDGSSVAFWVGHVISSALGAGAGQPSVFVVPARGGAPRALRTGLAEAAHPVWSPDGRHLLVYGSQAPLAQLPLGPAKPAADWWTLPADGGTATPTGAFRYFEKQGFATTSLVEIPRPGYWGKDGVLFFARLGDSVNLWRVPISERDLRVNAPAERVTSGTAIEAHPSLSGDGRMAFAGLSLQVNLWSIPIDVNEGRKTGEIRRLTQGVVFDEHPSLCPDSSEVVFNSKRPEFAKPAIWIRQLESGRETLLAQGDAEPFHPQISADCRMVAFTQRDGDYIVPAGGGPPERICTDCSMIWDWSSDRRQMLFSKRQRPSIYSFDLSTKQDRVALSSEGEPLFQARLSPDQSWLSFLRMYHGLWVSPQRDGSPTSESEWFPITENNVRADKPRWSPNGTIVYYTSDRDGFWCLWGQHVHPTTKRPIGPPFAVYHFHSARLSMENVGSGGQEISVSKDMIVLNLGELTGNIWSSRH
jgi:Tol biopolymer transport system component/DNA-binding winged helix-turn-helix (wHTH) protein